jgi:hypothetical protein
VQRILLHRQAARPLELLVLPLRALLLLVLPLELLALELRALLLRALLLRAPLLLVPLLLVPLELREPLPRRHCRKQLRTPSALRLPLTLQI